MDQKDTFYIPNEPAQKSRAEIEELKRQWVADPIWDIEDTEGFEAHREELLAFRKQCEQDWAFDRMRMQTPGEFINTEEQIIRAVELIEDWENNDRVAMDTLVAAQAHALVAIADAMERVVQRLNVICDQLGLMLSE